MQVQVHASMNPSTTSSVASLGNIGRWAVAPLQQIEVLHLYRWYTHTHTPHRSGADEMKMKVRWKWKWNEIYLTRTRRGERKRRGTERTPTQHTWPGEKARRKKRKAEADGQRNKTSGGGEDGSAWTNLTRRKPTPTSAREGPNLPVEKRTHEIRDPWGTS